MYRVYLLARCVCTFSLTRALSIMTEVGKRFPLPSPSARPAIPSTCQKASSPCVRRGSALSPFVPTGSVSVSVSVRRRAPKRRCSRPAEVALATRRRRGPRLRFGSGGVAFGTCGVVLQATLSPQKTLNDCLSDLAACFCPEQTCFCQLLLFDIKAQWAEGRLCDAALGQ